MHVAGWNIANQDLVPQKFLLRYPTKYDKILQVFIGCFQDPPHLGTCARGPSRMNFGVLVVDSRQSWWRSDVVFLFMYKYIMCLYMSHWSAHTTAVSSIVYIYIVYYRYVCIHLFFLFNWNVNIYLFSCSLKDSERQFLQKLMDLLWTCLSTMAVMIETMSYLFSTNLISGPLFVESYSNLETKVIQRPQTSFKPCLLQSGA